MGAVASPPLVLAAGAGAAIGGGAYLIWNIATKNDFDSIDFTAASVGCAVGAVALPAAGILVNPVTAAILGAESDDEFLWATGTGLTGRILAGTNITGFSSVGSGLVSNVPQTKKPSSKVPSTSQHFKNQVLIPR